METNGVTFIEEQSNDLVSNIHIVRERPKGMLALLVAHKVVKTGKQAETFLLAIAIICVLAAIIVVVLWQTGKPRTEYHGPALGPAVPTPIRP